MSNQKLFLLYYTSEYDSDKVKEFAKANRPKNGLLLIRSAEAFDGQVEEYGGQNPAGILLIGNGFAADRVTEAYEKAEIKVQSIDLDDEDFDEEILKSEGRGDPFEGDFDRLKARAAELSVQFPSNIRYDTLLAKVTEAEAEAEAKE